MPIRELAATIISAASIGFPFTGSNMNKLLIFVQEKILKTVPDSKTA
ncbi:uncharacterized protein METZ01_LOCUS93632 [marine metagenome]|uniref:Uncharacterized protein n=1 Tax=marine metagenome TaxID=408172 RepID=A0A381VLX5_9ZZZZ